MASHQPHLFHSLRTALGVLYNIPTSSDQHEPKPTSAQAHEFLMQFQSRNVRRKLQSLAQRQQDTREGASNPQLDVSPTIELEDMGSSWFACLSLLFSLVQEGVPTTATVHYAEGLFAAQTLVHRLRRVKTEEAIDLEFEPPIHGLPPHANQLYDTYCTWMERLSPSVRTMLQQYAPSSTDEERVKGELTMITLMNIMLRLTCLHLSDISRIRPLLATLASALSVTAARPRFTSNSIPHPAPNTQPIVTMILHTLNMVRSAMEASTPSDHLAAAHQYVFYICITVVPDAILAGSGSGDGAHGKMSMDPRCYTAMTTEVRTQGITQVWEAMNDMPPPQDEKLVLFLHMCEEWAKYAPLPLEFVQRSIVLVEQVFSAAAAHPSSYDTNSAVLAALRYWTAIMEGGSWTVEEVLSASLLQRGGSSQQPNKKKQSSKSKKRQKEVLDERTTANQLVLAENEVRHRGEVAMAATKASWTSFRTLLSQELARISDTDDEVPGDGPVGAITACANACLTFIVRDSWHSQETLELFVSIAHGIQDICRCPSRMVRGFAAETLYKLHETLLEVLHGIQGNFNSDLESVIVEHFFQCCMNLAQRCSYPPGYFRDLSVNNDEDLESERNDVRDVLRTVAGTTSSEGKSLPSVAAHRVCSTVLHRLLVACAESIISEAADARVLYPESAIHAFSALARPLIAASRLYVHNPNDAQAETLTLALKVITVSGERLTKAFGLISLNETLPMSRLYNLSVASLSTMLAALCTVDTFKAMVSNVMAVSIQAAMTSLYYVPELAAPSTLRSTRYDIRGAMRTPGGEDHAGCLSLMRLSTESNDLAHVFVGTKQGIALELCKLYTELKNMEVSRGRGVLHGKGVLPKSRRILLGVICHLELVTGGQSMASDQLRSLFMNSIEAIVRSHHAGHVTIDSVFDMTEHVFDMAAFSPEMINAYFQFSEEGSTSPSAVCLQILYETGKLGFNREVQNQHELLLEWNRFRAALFCLFKGSGAPDIPGNACHPLVEWTREECNAALAQCALGPRSSSSVFCDELISEEVVPAGIFIQVVLEVLSRGYGRGIPLVAMPNCISILSECKHAVLQAVGSTCPNPFEKGSFCDPRPTIAEAWILVTSKLIEGQESLHHNPELARTVHQLVVETCLTCVGVLFYPSLGKTQETRANDPGFTVDGPHMLVMMDFLPRYFCLGPSMIQSAALELINRIPVEMNSVRGHTTDPCAVGIAIIAAAIFRAAQGGLPPWAVESVPALFSSLYIAIDKSPDNFTTVVKTAMTIRLSEVSGFGGVKPGELLSGRFFDSMGAKAKGTFIEQAVEIARADTQASWKRLKALVKQACGGKKKDTDFGQRPGLTKYDSLDRV
eukprot:Nitzschia sp. Nitz4//scaffold34_size148208//140021//144097//NITZ4_002999-RA/size148208-processed-gene-0.27-mRNA-1//1//CDS//3329548852//2126//frame0